MDSGDASALLLKVQTRGPTTVNPNMKPQLQSDSQSTMQVSESSDLDAW